MTANPGRRLPAWPARTGPRPLIGRRPAQQLARHELSRSMYQQSIPTRIVNWIEHELSVLLSGASRFPGGVWTVTALLACVVLVAAGVTYWIRPAGSRGRSAIPLDAARLSAGEYRVRAERAAAAGDYSAAIIDRVRAVAAEISERGILADRPGRTADELAAEAAVALPALAAALASTARLFDEVRYGNRTGTEDGYRSACDLDTRIRSTRAGVTAVTEPA